MKFQFSVSAGINHYLSLKVRILSIGSVRKSFFIYHISEKEAIDIVEFFIRLRAILNGTYS